MSLADSASEPIPHAPDSTTSSNPPVALASAASSPEPAAPLPLQGRLSPLLREVARLAASELGVAYSSLIEPTGDSRTLRMVLTPTASQADGQSPQPREQIISRSGTMAGYAVQLPNATVSVDLRSESRFQDSELLDLRIISALVLPIVHNGELLAALGLYRTEVKPFPVDQIWFVERLVSTVKWLVDAIGSSAATANCRKQSASSVKQDWPTGEELRSSPRHRFQYSQAMAPVREGKMPAASDFVTVQCCDLSSGGASFYWDRPLPSKQIVLALGRAATCTHFRAEVVHVREFSCNGRPMYQIGCRFLERVYL
jgi:hypothetical protein